MRSGRRLEWYWTRELIGHYGYPSVFCVTIQNRDLCVDLRYLTD
jgi:hypothetical protein